MLRISLTTFINEIFLHLGFFFSLILCSSSNGLEMTTCKLPDKMCHWEGKEKKHCYMAILYFCGYDITSVIWKIDG